MGVVSIGKYSAGFGALSVFQGMIMAFIRETIEEDLLVLVQAPASALNIQQMAVPTDAKITNYYAPGATGNLCIQLP
jgi:hypothetical protein